MKKQREDSTELTVKGVAKGIAGEEALVGRIGPIDRLSPYYYGRVITESVMGLVVRKSFSNYS